jgi:hypothetical protein
MEGGRRARRYRQRHDLHLAAPERPGEETVVRAHEPVTAGGECEGRAVSPDARVHHRQVHGIRREPMPGPADQVGGGPHVTRVDRVGDVHQQGSRGVAEDDCFQLGDVRIADAEVGEQSDEGHGLGVWLRPGGQATGPVGHAVARSHLPQCQSAVIAAARAIAVSASIHQIPSNP